MKKYKTIILMCIFTTLGIIIGRYTSKNDVYKEDTIKRKNNNTISMMLETNTNSKTYIQSTDSTWPTDGYVFNEEMSKCEQGSTLKWDDTNKKVVMEGNRSDKCYVFFDKYDSIKINSYSISPIDDTINITIDATSGTGTISKYYYSKDDGVTYEESESNIYIFNDLTIGTYKIKVYIMDSNGKKSNTISKEINVIPKPTNPTMEFDSAYKIIISGSTSKNGNVEYYYSFDNKTFTKGNTITVNNSTNIYAYSIDIKNQKSDTISKYVTISASTNETVSSYYYCSKTNTYQSSSKCSYSYAATGTTTYSCSESYYEVIDGTCYYQLAQVGTHPSLSSCNSQCIEGETSSNYECLYKTSGTRGYACYRNYGSATASTSYSCPDGGSLSKQTCTGATYSGTLKYKCVNEYYDTKATATTACTNYCSIGAYYNGTCYDLK